MNEIEFAKTRALLIAILTAGMNASPVIHENPVGMAEDQADGILTACGIVHPDEA